MLDQFNTKLREQVQGGECPYCGFDIPWYEMDEPCGSCGKPCCYSEQVRLHKLAEALK